MAHSRRPRRAGRSPRPRARAGRSRKPGRSRRRRPSGPPPRCTSASRTHGISTLPHPSQGGYSTHLAVLTVTFLDPKVRIMGRREDKKRETRERLQAAAFARFQQHGYDESKIEDIAQDAGVSPRTVYRYFPTKADLVYPDTGDNAAAVSRLIADRPASEPPFTALRAALVQFAPTLDSEVNFARGRLIAIDPTLYRYSLEVRDRMGNAMGQALVDRGGDGGSESDRRLLGHLAMAALLVALRTWRDEGDESETLAEHAASTLDAIPRLVKMPA